MITKWIVDEEPPECIVYVSSQEGTEVATFVDSRDLDNARALLVESMRLIYSILSEPLDWQDIDCEFGKIRSKAEQQGIIV